jgi:hypothetical protein
MTTSIQRINRGARPAAVLAAIAAVTAATPDVSHSKFLATEPLSTSLTCPTANAAADSTVADLRDAMSGTSAADSSFRRELGIEGLPASALSTVTDSLVCTKVTQVLDSVFKVVPASTSSIFVLRVGVRYIAFPHLLAIRPKYILDTNYVFIGATPY